MICSLLITSSSRDYLPGHPHDLFKKQCKRGLGTNARMYKTSQNVQQHTPPQHIPPPLAPLSLSHILSPMQPSATLPMAEPHALPQCHQPGCPQTDFSKHCSRPCHPVLTVGSMYLQYIYRQISMWHLRQIQYTHRC